MCVFVCLHRYLKSIWPIFTKLFVLVAHGRVSVLLGQHCNVLCTLSFVDDVTFYHDELYSDMMPVMHPLLDNGFRSLLADSRHEDQMGRSTRGTGPESDVYNCRV